MFIFLLMELHVILQLVLNFSFSFIMFARVLLSVSNSTLKKKIICSYLYNFLQSVFMPLKGRCYHTCNKRVNCHRIPFFISEDSFYTSFLLYCKICIDVVFCSSLVMKFSFGFLRSLVLAQHLFVVSKYLFVYSLFSITIHVFFHFHY